MVGQLHAGHIAAIIRVHGAEGTGMFTPVTLRKRERECREREYR